LESSFKEKPELFRTPLPTPPSFRRRLSPPPVSFCFLIIFSPILCVQPKMETGSIFFLFTPLESFPSFLPLLVFPKSSSFPYTLRYSAPVPNGVTRSTKIILFFFKEENNRSGLHPLRYMDIFLPFTCYFFPHSLSKNNNAHHLHHATPWRDRNDLPPPSVTIVAPKSWNFADWWESILIVEPLLCHYKLKFS